jgi:hypothetical protein
VGLKHPAQKIHHTIAFIQPTHAQGAQHADRLGKKSPTTLAAAAAALAAASSAAAALAIAKTVSRD